MTYHVTRIFTVRWKKWHFPLVSIGWRVLSVLEFTCVKGQIIRIPQQVPLFLKFFISNPVTFNSTYWNRKYYWSKTLKYNIVNSEQCFQIFFLFFFFWILNFIENVIWLWEIFKQNLPGQQDNHLLLFLYAEMSLRVHIKQYNITAATVVVVVIVVVSVYVFVFNLTWSFGAVQKFLHDEEFVVAKTEIVNFVVGKHKNRKQKKQKKIYVQRKKKKQKKTNKKKR